MALFKGAQTKGGHHSDDVETIIGPSVKIDGEFSSTGNVMIAGVINGKFSTSQSLRVEERAKILADVSAKEAVIAGEIDGNVTIEGHVEILSSARISGDIKTGSISIQQGANINGNFSMTGMNSVQMSEETVTADKVETPSLKEEKEEWTEDNSTERVL
jgi:cytoskeletal protein CcmA (bactofilin family)